MAAPERLVEFEEEIRHLPLPGDADEFVAVAPLSESTTSRLRGIGRLVVEPEDPARPVVYTPGRLFALARQLAAHPETVRGAWIRQLDLENPGD